MCRGTAPSIFIWSVDNVMIYSKMELIIKQKNIGGKYMIYIYIYIIFIFHKKYSSQEHVYVCFCLLFCYLFPFCVEFYKILRNETIASVFDVAVLVLLQGNKIFVFFLRIKVNQILTNIQQNLWFPPPIIDTDFGEDNPSSKYYDDHKCYINLRNNCITLSMCLI